MKKLLITTLLSLPILAFSQVKKDTTYRALGVVDGFKSGVYTIPFPDTTKVWYYEVKELNGVVVDHWTEGYKVQVLGDYVSSYPIIYLEEDRKTKVKNYVVYSIPRK